LFVVTDGQSNRLLKESWQPTVVQLDSGGSPTNVMNSTEVFFLATKNESAMNLRVVNLNSSAVGVGFSWAGDGQYTRNLPLLV